MILSSGSSSSYPSTSSKMEDFKTFHTGLTHSSTDESKEDILRSFDTNESSSSRPRPPDRPTSAPFTLPITPIPDSPSTNIDDIFLVRNDAISPIKADVSMTASLEYPLYLSGARILNTPTRGERLSTLEDSKEDSESLSTSESHRSVRLSVSDEKLRFSITRSLGGIGTTPIHLSDSSERHAHLDDESQAERNPDDTESFTSTVARAMSLQEASTSNVSDITCVSCGEKRDAGHTRFCLVCCEPFCKTCKKKKMKRLSKKAWACLSCVERVDTKEKGEELFCNRCGSVQSSRGHDRHCLLCRRHFCEVCKKKAMFKLARKEWVCHTHAV